MKQKTALWVVIGVALAVTAMDFIMPLLAKPARPGRISDALASARPAVGGLKVYAAEHGGQFPESLEAVVPNYCPAGQLPRKTTRHGDAAWRWQYFPGHQLNESPRGTILKVTWLDGDSNSQRGVVYSDGSAEVIDEGGYKWRIF